MGTRTREQRRRICFVTGSRAEFGLMRPVMQAIRRHPKLQLQIVATGMHLDPAHGKPLAAIAGSGIVPDAVVPWPAGSGANPTVNAANTGSAIAELSRVFGRLGTEVVLVVGDRVEALAGAVAAHVSHLLLAHVHGGDRALGQIDDSLRHAITKLAHVHFPATQRTAQRIRRLGEEDWRIHRVGSPAVDGIAKAAEPWRSIARAMPGLRRRRYALLVLHPAAPDVDEEYVRAARVLRAARSAGFGRVVIVRPNNDPGSAGIMRCWDECAADASTDVVADLPRARYLGLLRDAAVLVGNSSSGIIEAGSFGTAVLDVGPRQTGRERGRNVAHCGYDESAILRRLRRIWNGGRPVRYAKDNIYGDGQSAARVADALARVIIGPATLRKVIRY